MASRDAARFFGPGIRQTEPRGLRPNSADTQRSSLIVSVLPTQTTRHPQDKITVEAEFQRSRWIAIERVCVSRTVSTESPMTTSANSSPPFTETWLEGSIAAPPSDVRRFNSASERRIVRLFMGE